MLSGKIGRAEYHGRKASGVRDDLEAVSICLDNSQHKIVFLVLEDELSGPNDFREKSRESN
jgi:hypothetical protein